MPARKYRDELIGEVPCVDVCDPRSRSHVEADGSIVIYPWARVSTPCHFGGERWWWVCPKCKRACRFLYQVAPGVVLCRICSRLTYDCRRNHERGKYAQLNRIRKIAFAQLRGKRIDARSMRWYDANAEKILDALPRIVAREAVDGASEASATGAQKAA